MEIAYREGASLVKYLDTQGVWTIGIGATSSEIPDLASWPLNKSMLIPDVIKMFIKSLDKYAKAVDDALKVEVEQHQFDALVSICYNIGIGGMRGSTFMKRINAKASSKDIATAIMAWTKNPELVGRRTGEMNLYTKGRYINDGTVLLFPVSDKTHQPLYKKGRAIDLRPYLESKEEAIEKHKEEPVIMQQPQDTVEPSKSAWEKLKDILLGF